MCSWFRTVMPIVCASRRTSFLQGGIAASPQQALVVPSATVSDLGMPSAMCVSSRPSSGNSQPSHIIFSYKLM